jgi:hypothetical protein
VAAIIEKMIDANDKPRAEIVIDVQILEVTAAARSLRHRADNYQIGTVFSPERIRAVVAAPGAAATSTLQHEPDVQPEHHHARGLDRGLLPRGAVGRRALSRDRLRNEADCQAAAARRRGQKITLNLGDDIPVPSPSSRRWRPAAPTRIR